MNKLYAFLLISRVIAGLQFVTFFIKKVTKFPLHHHANTDTDGLFLFDLKAFDMHMTPYLVKQFPILTSI